MDTTRVYSSISRTAQTVYDLKDAYFRQEAINNISVPLNESVLCNFDLAIISPFHQ